MNRKKKILMLFIIALFIAIPFIFIGGDFDGADALAEELVQHINPDYEPWFETIFPELSGEMETFIFSLQAALGAGVVGYILGSMRGKYGVTEKI